jgi:hypothetical protein
MKRLITHAALAVCLLGSIAPAHAHRPGASDASLLSALPIAMSTAAPAMLLSGTVALTVVAVEASATGAVWVLERASDGARLSVKLAASTAGGLSLATGTALTVSTVGAGWVLSAAGKAIAFIPNEIGMALLHNERVSR